MAKVKNPIKNPDEIKSLVFTRRKGDNEDYTHNVKTGNFSDFFLRASDEDKKQVFIEAARKANEEQRDVFLKSQLKTKNY